MGVRMRRAGLVTFGIAAGLVMTAPSALADPPNPAPAPAPAPGNTTQADGVTPPNGVPHLSSPDNLPPGTSDQPADPSETPSLSYLRELWHAVQDQNISKRDALMLLTQRPMDPNSAPPPGVAAGPEAPPGSPPPAGPHP